MQSSGLVLMFYSFVASFSLIVVVDGAHFLGGTITWRPLNASATGSPVDIVITQTYSWTYSLGNCTSAMIASNQLVPLTGFYSTASQNLTCTSNCATGSGGFTPIPISPRCTDFSSPVGTTVGQRSDIVRLQSTANFTAAYQYRQWRNLTTISNANWSLSTRINLERRPDNGLYNSAPVATVISPIYIRKGVPTAIHIPIADADGDPMRCRWSAGDNECGGICPPGSLPNGTIIFPNCTIIMTGTDIGHWFGVALMVEDFINSSSTRPLSSVPVQFLVRVVGIPPCNVTPAIVGIPQEDSCTPIAVGQSFNTELIAINYCGSNVTILDIATLSFPGMIKGNLNQLNSTTYIKQLSWTPTTSQLGYQVMCAMAFDSQSAQSSQYCFTFYVSQTGTVGCPTAATVAPTTAVIPGVTTDSLSTASVTQTAMITSEESSITSSSPSSGSITTEAQTSDVTVTVAGTANGTVTNSSTSMLTTVATTSKSTHIPWPLIGTLIGLLVLASLGLCCLCWRLCCWFPYFPLIHGERRNIELYHIERCRDPHCHRNGRDISSGRSRLSSTSTKMLISRASSQSIDQSQVWLKYRGEIKTQRVVPFDGRRASVRVTHVFLPRTVRRNSSNNNTCVLDEMSQQMKLFAVTSPQANDDVKRTHNRTKRLSIRVEPTMTSANPTGPRRPRVAHSNSVQVKRLSRSSFYFEI